MSNQRHPKVRQTGQGELLHVQGVAFMYKAETSDTDGKYALTEGVVSPHHGPPLDPHHQEDEAFYILEGEFELESAGKVFHAGEGAFALLPKDLPHRFQNLADRPGKFPRVHSPAGIEEFQHRSVLAEKGPPDAGKIREFRGEIGYRILSAREPLTRQPLAVHWLGL
jgi:mannose-6-phosphate isomerase-like protein (cupin superfamily)